MKKFLIDFFFSLDETSIVLIIIMIVIGVVMWKLFPILNMFS